MRELTTLEIEDITGGVGPFAPVIYAALIAAAGAIGAASISAFGSGPSVVINTGGGGGCGAGDAGAGGGGGGS